MEANNNMVHGHLHVSGSGCLPRTLHNNIIMYFTLYSLGLSSLNNSLTSEQAKDKLKAVENEVKTN